MAEFPPFQLLPHQDQPVYSNSNIILSSVPASCSLKDFQKTNIIIICQSIQHYTNIHGTSNTATDCRYIQCSHHHAPAPLSILAFRRLTNMTTFGSQKSDKASGTENSHRQDEQRNSKYILRNFILTMSSKEAF